MLLLLLRLRPLGPARPPGPAVAGVRRAGRGAEREQSLSRAVFPDNLATRAWVFHWAKPFYAAVDEEDEYGDFMRLVAAGEEVPGWRT